MPSQKIRSIVAAAALAAGVTWLAVGATQASACGNKGRAVATSDAAGRDCGEGRALHPHDGPPGSSVLTPEAVQLSMAAGELARHAGISGMAAGNPAPGLADLGGIVATWGMPSLSTSSPEFFPSKAGPAGMEDLATAAHVPTLPSLPLPGTQLAERVPNKMAIGHGPHHNKVSAAGRAITAKDSNGIEKPVHEIGARVIGEVLPNAMKGLESTSILPGGVMGVEGLAGLVNGFNLR
ncbi:hypothetical protein ETD86_30205 [Nonomuraea turkmeniaca]|uniref:Uncharacterized protein n=1 Tax=Nonomuraea turkmeniaca TaxID=103838 RepID=A0A5S4F9U2_9ACTN|nr:hypothetical protein [Nonomuraea turkmeniaca]TMR13715.1 hypothetical protein ETD86_30205 [Nonomuraea turkmeniaca]